jgi:hypothetical protein
VGIQAFTSEGPVERFDVRVVSRLARSREVDLRTASIGPQIHRMTGELTAIVTEQHLRHSAFELQPIQCSHDIISFQALSHFDCHSFPRVDIYDRQRTEPGAVL